MRETEGGPVCPGPENNSWHRAERTYQAELEAWGQEVPALRGDPPKPPAIEPVPGDPVWCSGCTAKIRVRLADLDDQVSILTAQADGHRPSKLEGQVSGGTVHAGSPSPVSDLLSELLGCLFGWEEAVREHYGWPGRPHRGRFAPAVTATAGWLASHLEQVLAFPGAGDFGTEVTQWWTRLRRLAHTDDEPVRRDAPCPVCSLRSLVEADGEVWCRVKTCVFRTSTDDYAALLEHAAKGARR